MFSHVWQHYLNPADAGGLSEVLETVGRDTDCHSGHWWKVMRQECHDPSLH